MSDLIVYPGFSHESRQRAIALRNQRAWIRHRRRAFALLTVVSVITVAVLAAGAWWARNNAAVLLFAFLFVCIAAVWWSGWASYRFERQLFDKQVRELTGRDAED